MLRLNTATKKFAFCLTVSAMMLMLCASLSIQPGFADDQDDQKKKKENQGLQLPDFNFLFGNGKKKQASNQQEPEIVPAFPITSKKKSYQNRNESEFIEDGNGNFGFDENSKKFKNNKTIDFTPTINGEDEKKRKSDKVPHADLYSGAYDEEGNRKNKKDQTGNLQLYPGAYDENGKKKNRKDQAGNLQLNPGVYDEDGNKKNKKDQTGNLKIYPGVYDEDGNKKNKKDQTGNLQIYPGVYDENGKKKKDSSGRTVDIYSSVYDEKDKNNKKASGPVNLSPYLYDEDGKKKKRDNNGNIQLAPYSDDDENRKKNRTASGGKMEILPGAGNGNNGDDGWNGNSPFGSQGILNSTGLGGIGGFFNPSRIGVGDRWGQHGTGGGGNRTRAIKRLPPRTGRPVITLPGGPGTGSFTELEQPLVEDPFKTSMSPSASGNPGQVSNYAKQNSENERDIHPGQGMWCGDKAQMPAYGDRSGSMASCFHQQSDVGCQPNCIPGARGVGGFENKVSERLGDAGSFLGFNIVGGDNDSASGNAMGVGNNAMGAAMENRPHQKMQEGQAQAMGQSNLIADAAAELGHDQGAQAMTYVGSYLHNFTTAGGNKWNQVRDNIFVPMGILLLLPGAMFTQVRAIMAQSNPVLGQAHPFEGILRSLVALFFIPGSYLVMNYGIDISNSLTYTIAEQYQRLFGTDMYNDAMCHEIKAMPFRLPEENRNTIDLKDHSMGRILVARDRGPFSKLEAQLLAVKIWDPCDGIYIVPMDRCQEVVPVPVIACRMACNLTNASLLTSWNILCAFQCAYLYFLWCMGPVVAGLWTWPMKQFRDAFPNWVEGVLAVCFWALFWNATVLVIALVRRDYETGTIIMIALNTIGNISVKFAFDFAGLIKSAGDEAMQFGDKLAEKAGNAGGR